jgi:hypothetical protein
LPRLVERLRARLGNDAVFAVGSVEDHRPEHAWRVLELPLPPPSPAPSRERVRGQASPTSGRGSRDRGRDRCGCCRAAEDCSTSRVLAGGARGQSSPASRRERPHFVARPERIETGWWMAAR